MQNGGGFGGPAGVEFLHLTSKFWSRGPYEGPHWRCSYTLLLESKYKCWLISFSIQNIIELSSTFFLLVLLSLVNTFFFGQDPEEKIEPLGNF
jgi:hypothetical protein